MEDLTRRQFIPLIAAGVGGLMLTCSNKQVPDAAEKEDASDKNNRKDEEKVHAKITCENSYPAALKSGDKIAIIAPAGPLRELKQCEDFVKILTELGFEVVVGENVKSKIGFFTAPDEARKNELEKFIADTSVKAIIGIKGGWGCARLLPILDYDLIKANPKIIMGFSDITALINGIWLKTGLVTFHGPVGTATWLDYSVDYVKRVLMDGEKVVYKSTENYKTLTGGEAEGVLIGGNLSVLTGLVGTSFFPDPKGKLLFLEDVEEEPFRIDRMLTHLKLAGIFDAVNGIIIGKCRKCEAEEPDFSFTVDEVYNDHFSKFGKPVYQGANIGHIRDKFTVPIGVKAKMNADECSFELLEAGVSL